MASVKSEFYITLPSNASMKVFPRNTQSHFITKLASALSLVNKYEVGLSEIIIPRSFFNITYSNNKYDLTYEEEIMQHEDYIKYEIPLTPLTENESLNKTEISLIETLNKNIHTLTKSNIVTFILENDDIIIRIWDDAEIHINPEKAEKLLYILNLPLKDTILSETSSFKFRKTTANLNNQVFFIIDKKNRKEEKFLIPLIASNQHIRDKSRKLSLFDHININIMAYCKTDKVYFFKPENTKTVYFHTTDDYVAYISSSNAPTLLKSLSLSTADIMLDRNEMLTYNDIEIEPSSGEWFHIVKKKSKKIPTVIKKTEELFLPIGHYTSAEELFSAFKVVKLNVLVNKKVELSIPENTQLRLGSGLKDLLGFKEEFFTYGKYISDYPLELNAGITEIFVYTDIIESHHVGDVSAPLLRVIPLSGEKDEQIVRIYNNPIYFPVKKKYIETIEIELRNSSGNNITFVSGKTILVLSFREREKL